MPFGPRAAPPEMPDSPPTAADFWGEHSASIHDALQIPADDEIDAPPHPPADLRTRGRRRVAIAAGLSLAVATAVAVVFALSGQSPHEAGGPRLNMAAVLSTSLSRVLERGLAHVHVRAASPHAAAAQHRAVLAGRAPRTRLVIKRVYEIVRHQASHPVSYATAASADVSHVSAVTTTHESTPSAAGGGTSGTTALATRPAEPAAASHPSRSSSAAVSPTGQSGALGPIQSPNG